MTVYSVPNSPYRSTAEQIAAQYNVPPELFVSLITKENPAWNPTAHSAANNNGTYDYGLAQLNSQYYPAESMSITDQLKTAAKKLSHSFNLFGNWYDALRAYNAGDTGASKDAQISSGYANDIIATANNIGWNAGNGKGNSVNDAVNNGGFVDAANAMDAIDQAYQRTHPAAGTSSDPGKPAAPPEKPLGQQVLDQTGITKAVSDAFNNVGNSFKSWAGHVALPGTFIIGGGIVVLLTLISMVNTQDAAKAALSVAKVVK